MLIVLLTVIVAGCSIMSPHIFSERMKSRSGAGEHVSLDEAYADVADLQRRYVAAIEEQGNAPPKLSAALIALTGWAAYNGITSPTTRGLAKAGIAGAMGYAASSTLLSRERLDVYRAGVEALSCAMLAVEPMRAGSRYLGDPSDDASKYTVYGSKIEVEERSEILQAVIDKHSALGEAQTQTAARGVRFAPGAAATTAKNCETIQNLSATERLVQINRCKKNATKTTVGRSSTQTVFAPRELLVALQAAEREQSRAQASVQAAENVVKALAAAGPALLHKSLAIQLAVSAEVDKTIPDPAAALRAAQGMPDVAAAISGLDFAAEAKARAQGGDEHHQTLTDKYRVPIKELQAATKKLAEARLKLDALVLPFTGVTEQGTREALNSCSVRTTGIDLKVSPVGDNIPIAQGKTAVFFVAGGSGAPSAQVMIGPKAPMPLHVEGGLFRFEYPAPASALPGEAVVLRFSDGTGTVSRFVTLRIVPGDSPADTGGKVSTGASSANTPPPASPAVPSGASAANVGHANTAPITQ